MDQLRNIIFYRGDLKKENPLIFKGERIYLLLKSIESYRHRIQEKL